MITKDYAVPIGSMYGIYANIWGILIVNVSLYSIHGSYGVYIIYIYIYYIILYIYYMYMYVRNITIIQICLGPPFDAQFKRAQGPSG